MYEEYAITVLFCVVLLIIIFQTSTLYFLCVFLWQAKQIECKEMHILKASNISYKLKHNTIYLTCDSLNFKQLCCDITYWLYCHFYFCIIVLPLRSTSKSYPTLILTSRLTSSMRYRSIMKMLSYLRCQSHQHWVSNTEFNYLIMRMFVTVNRNVSERRERQNK